MLEVDVTCSRGDFTLKFAASVPGGSTLGVFGPSGSGKTTLIEAVAGLFTPVAGTVAVAGRQLFGGSAAVPVPPNHRRIGLVRQRAALFPHLTVDENIHYAAGADRARARHLVERFGLERLGARRPSSLSGGEAQRVAFVRVLAVPIDLLLLDEPLTGLDVELRGELATTVREVVRELEIPCLVAAHELTELERMVDTLAILVGGRLLQVGEVSGIYAAPQRVEVAENLGMQLLPARESATGRELRLAIHPEAIRFGAGSGMALPVTVEGVRFLRGRYEHRLGYRGRSLVAYAGEPLPAGEAVARLVTPHLFDPDGWLAKLPPGGWQAIEVLP